MSWFNHYANKGYFVMKYLQALNRKTSLVFYLWASLLFIMGGLLWGFFFDWGQFPLDFHDWAIVSGPRLTFLQNAVQQGVLPFHISSRTTFAGMTDRFMGVPDVILSPQVILLRWMDIKTFALVDTLIMYAVGFVGLIWFCRRQRLSALAFTFLFLLFNFNGHLVAHFAVGHLTWVTGYFLFPWLLVYVFDLLDDKTGWKWVFGVSLVTFVMFLNGGSHYFIYSLMLLALLAVTLPRHFWLIVKTILFSALLSAVRIFPVALNLAAFHERIAYTAGNFTLTNVLDSFLNIYGANVINNNGMTDYIGKWEYSNYIGAVGFLFLVVFGLYFTYQNREKTGSPAIFSLPAIALTILSLDQIFKYLQIILPIPPFTGERVPGRIVTLAFLLVLALAVIEFQRWYENKQPALPYTLAGFGTALILAHDLWQNFRAWQIGNISRQFEVVQFNPAIAQVANHADGKYYAALLVGAAISLVTFGILAFFRFRKQAGIRSAISTQVREEEDSSQA